MDASEQSTELTDPISGEFQESQTNNEHSTAGLEPTQTVTFKFAQVAEAVELNQTNEQPTNEVAEEGEISADVNTGQVEASQPIMVQPDVIPTGPNDQEMGLAVAILELIGSQPHITVNQPEGSQEHQSTQFIDVPVQDTNQQGDYQDDQTTEITEHPIYPVAIAMVPEGMQQQKASAKVEISLASAADEGLEDEVDPEWENGEEKGKGSGSKKKRGKIKAEKRKAGDEQGKEDKSPKKRKKSDKKKGEEKISTSEALQSNDGVGAFVPAEGTLIGGDQETQPETPGSNKFLCTICDSAFNRKDNLKVHARKKHNAEVIDNNTATERTKCLNPQCEKTFYHKTQMLRHMEQEHGLEVQKKEIEFKSLEEFKKWKVEEETNKFVFFSSYRGPAMNKSGKSSHLYFKCQKDGPNRPHRKLGEPGRKTTRRNKKGSVKTGILCPARMICKVDGKSGKVNLSYISSHSHPISSSDTQYQPVSDHLKKEIMDKLAVGTPVKQVYKDLRKVSLEQTPKSASESAVKAVHHITQRTLELMKHKVDMSRRLHHDESISILLLVEKLKAETFNSVLLYKPQGGVTVVGDESLVHLPFADDLAVLAMQTEEQMKVLKQNTSKVIYVDTTYANNPTDHKLITLVVPDTNQQGYPVAHLIANRIDEHLLYYFVKAIKERCQGFQPYVVMTDEDNTGYGVFQAVYPGVTFTHLLSKWHVHRAWLKRMGKELQNSTLRQEMYHCLVMMMEEPNSSRFNEMASNFVNYYATKSQTFTEYFVEMYRARPELWAMSFRGKEQPNDVLHMNFYHSNLRAFFQQKRKASKRLDALVNCLLDMDKDAAWKRVKRVFEEGGSDPTSGQFYSHHEKGMVIPEDQVEDAGEQDTWFVPSYDQKIVKHTVKKLYNICLDDHCHHKCLQLCCFALCHHLYECSCYDEVNICQHIHRVHSFRVAQLQVPQSIQCPPAADLGAYVEIHYMDEDEAVGVATESIQTSEVTAATEAEVVTAVETTGDGSSDQVGTLQTRLQHLVNLLGTRQVDDILLSHVTGTVDQLISTCEAANNVPDNVPVTQS